VKALLNGAVWARTPKRAREAACAPQKPALPKGLGPAFIDITVPVTTITGQRLQDAVGSVKPMAWAEASDAALPMVPLWVLASVAAWLLPML
jgi:hypothetical protein